MTAMSGKQYHLQVGEGEIGQYVLLPGDPGRAEKIASALDEHWLVASNREYTTYTGTLGGVRVSVCSTGIGCPSTAIAAEELVKLGAHTLIRVGTAGARQTYVNIGDLVVATGAVRDEGTSPQYIPIDYPAIADVDVVLALREAANKAHLPSRLGILHSKDSFYSQSEPDTVPLGSEVLAKRDALRRGHVLASEMEASTLFVISSIRQVRAGAIVKILNNRLVDTFDTEKAFRLGLGDLIDTAVEAVRILIRNDATSGYGSR